MHALFIQHRTKPGQRDAVEAVWRKYMPEAIGGNAGHVLYTYCFGSDPDVIAAFQIYRSKEEADAFLQSLLYAAYLDESRALITHTPQVTVLTPHWIKAGGDIIDLVGQTQE